MKTIDIFCASQAAITTMNNSDIDHHHPSSSNNGGRAIDRHNPIIQDEKRLTKKVPPIPPTSNTQNNKNQNKSKKVKNNDQKSKNIAFADENNDQQVIMNRNNHVGKKPGSVLLGWGCTRPGNFISPATSSRFLLADKALSEQFDPLLLKQVSSSPALPPPPQPLPQKIDIYDGEKSFRKKDDGNIPATSSSLVKSLPRSSSSRSSDQQVVVLRVSLHCKGCEKKMRKHISKMEGVTSFNIDFMAKKVTVVGDITPLAVLASVSKVKNAKLLSPTTISSSTVPHMDSSFSEIKKQLGLVA